MGHRGEPRAGRGLAGAAGGELQSREGRLCDLAPPIFPPAFFMALPDLPRRNGTAVVVGKGQGLGMQHRGCAPGALKHGGFEGVDQHVVGNATKELQGLVVAREAMLHGLGDGALDIQHAAGAQAQDKEAPPAWRLPHPDGAKGAPLALGPCTGGKGPRKAGGLPAGSDGAHLGFDQGRAAGQALLAAALAPLRRRRGIALAPPDNLWCAWIQCAGSRAGFPRSKGLVGAPGGDRAVVQGDCLGALCRVPPLGRVEVCDLAEAVLGDHPHTSQRRANTALRSTGSSSAATGEALGGAPLGAVARAQPWSSGR
jgi:hypothetical protein